MTGHIHLGKYFHKIVFCILYDFADFILGIKATVVSWLIGSWWSHCSPSTYTLGTPRTDLRELRQTFDFDTPTFVIGKMPMQAVVFVAHHLIDELLHLFFREKMPRHIQHHAAPREARVVFDLHTRRRPQNIIFNFFTFDFFGQ